MKLTVATSFPAPNNWKPDPVKLPRNDVVYLITAKGREHLQAVKERE